LTGTGKVFSHNGSGWERQVAQNYSGVLTNDSKSGIGSFVFTQTYSIPSNVLIVGSTVRVRASGIVTSASGQAIQVLIRIGGLTLAATASRIAAGNDIFVLEGFATVRSTGASGGIALSGTGFFDASGASGSPVAQHQVTTIDTTAVNIVDVQVVHSIASATTRLDQLVMEVI
jgi:hypothetical protein